MRPSLIAVLLALAGPAHAAVVVVLPIADDAALTSEVRAAIGAHATVQAAATTADSVAAAKSLGISCNQVAPSCLAQLGGLAGGDLVVGGVIVRVPEGAQLTLRLVEVASGRLVRSADAVVPGTAGPRARALRRLAVQLVAPEKVNGSLTIFAPAGAAIRLDDAPVGTAPLGKSLEVPPGRHEVYAALAGTVSASAVVEIDIGENASVTLDLKPDADGDGEPDMVGPKWRPEGPLSVGTVAITSVEGDAAPELKRTVADAVAHEIAKLEGVEVVRLRDVEESLPPDVAVMLSCHEEGCHTLVGERLAVEDLIVVEVTDATDGRTLALRRFSGRAGRLLSESVRSGLSVTDDDDLAQAIGPAVRIVFPMVGVRPGEVRGIESLREAKEAEASLALRGEKRGLPPWVFWTTLATTGAVATTAGALTAWRLVEDGPAKDSVELSMRIAIGASAALVAADVAVALATEW